METLDRGVAVPSALLEIPVDGEDGAVEIDGRGIVAARDPGTRMQGVTDHTLELLDVARGELGEILPGGRRSRHGEIIEMLPRGRLAPKLLEIGQMRAAGNEVVYEAHDEVGCRDATPALLHRAPLEPIENTELHGQVGDELESRKRGDLVRRKNVVDASGGSCYLHFTSAPSWSKAIAFTPSLLPVRQHFFLSIYHEQVRKTTGLSVDQGLGKQPPKERLET